MADLSYQRHRCLEAVRRLLRCRAAVTYAWEEHQKALAVLAATGAQIAVRDGSGMSYDARQRTANYCQIRLPSEDLWERAQADERAAWTSLVDDLARSPAVQAELFAMLGA